MWLQTSFQRVVGIDPDTEVCRSGRLRNLREAAELKITHANRIDHNTLHLNSLETQLSTSVVILSTQTLLLQPTYKLLYMTLWDSLVEIGQAIHRGDYNSSSAPLLLYAGWCQKLLSHCHPSAQSAHN